MCCQVITKLDENGKQLEPFEEAIVEVPEAYVGAVVELLAQRRGAWNGNCVDHLFLWFGSQLEPVRPRVFFLLILHASLDLSLISPRAASCCGDCYGAANLLSCLPTSFLFGFCI